MERSKLEWSDGHHSDVADITRLQEYLLVLRGTFEHDPELTKLPGTKKK